MTDLPTAAPQEDRREGPTPRRIQELGAAFRSSRVFLSAVELGVFRALAPGPLDGCTLAERTGVHPRGARDFFDALVALGVLERDGYRYANSAEAATFLDPASPSYVGGMAEMQATRGYRVWGSLTSALRSGQPQTDAKGDFRLLYQDPERMRRYLRAMTAGSLGSARAIARCFPWERYRTFVDVGTAEGCLPVQVALAHHHLAGAGFDLPVVAPAFARLVASHGLAQRLRFFGGDLVVDELPPADVVVMGNLLCDFDLCGKQALMAKAHSALPAGGALVVYEPLIDDDRRHNLAALLASVGMLLQKEGAFGFSGAECRSWMAEVGFGRTYVEPLDGPRAMVVGFK